MAEIPEDDVSMEEPVEEWFLGLIVAEIVAVVLDIAQIPPASKRTKKKIFAAIAQLPQAVQDKIRVSALARPRRKRKCTDTTQLQTPTKRKKSGVDIEPEDEDEDMDLDPAVSLLQGPFLKAPPLQVLRTCTERYIDRTSNKALEKQICLVCARLLPSEETEEIDFDDLPNKRLLIPLYPHPAHRLKDIYLVHEDVMDDSITHVCGDCYTHLSKNIRPSLALSNAMWIGRIPLQLEILTLPERILISLYFPAVFIVKLFPKGRNEHNWNQNTVNSGMKGNVSTYKLHRADIASLVSGKTMPPTAAILSATIGVTFVGAKNVPLRILPDMFRVRRRRVREALEWLRDHNPIYADVVISHERLEQLPWNAVPDEILETTRYDEDRTRLDAEQAGYVPVYEEDFECGDVGLPLRVGLPSGMIPVVAEGEGEDNEPFEPAVFPLQSLGVVDTQADSVPENDVMAHAIANTFQPKRKDEFGIRRGSAYINEYPRVDDDGFRTDGGTADPNHMLGAFPVLFPYGKGGFETTREQEVPYEAHVRWALRYSDGRFRRDLYFIFQAFGVIQKRQVCRSAGLQIKRSAFIQNKAAFLQLRPQDLIKASGEETRRVAFSNPIVQSLRNQVTSIRARVPGTDESRQSIRSQIWGMNLMCNPATIWCTINLADMDDPIAQVLAGEDIDMDDFINTAGPTGAKRSLNISNDPFAAAEFFHVTINLILEEVFGIKAKAGRISRKDGVCGLVRGYIGTVEAQGRGTLHLHLLLWLIGAPSPSQMREALKSEEFRAKIRDYIQRTIRADIKGQDAHSIPAIPVVQNVAYARPIDPRKPNYERLCHAAEAGIARTVQTHDCNWARCLQMRGGRAVCKRRAPFPLASRDWIDESGDWGPRRVYGKMNNWNPTLLQLTHSNHDMKLVTHGHETKDITWYITLYIAKKQIQASNTSALLAQSLAYHKKADKHITTCKDINKRMITQCANTLSREQELSGPEVVNYLMGWGDRFISHTFVTIYWDEVGGALRRAYPGLTKSKQRNNMPHEEILECDSERAQPEPPRVSSRTEPENDTTARVEMVDGVFVLKSQLKEYSDRGHELDDVNFFDYFLETYHGVCLKGDPEESTGRGRPRSTRVPYLESSGRKGCRVVRQAGHDHMPRFVGAWFPRDSDATREHYCACMLALLCPWRDVSDLKETGETFDSVFSRFMAMANEDIHRIVDNVNYFHECSDQGRKRKGDMAPSRNAMLDVDEYIRTQTEREEMEASMPDLGEDDVAMARANRWTARDTVFGLSAIAIARQAGIFSDPEDVTLGCMLPECGRAAKTDIFKYKEWSAKLAALSRKHGFVHDNRVRLPVAQGGEFTVAKAPRRVDPGVVYLPPQNATQRTKELQTSLDRLNVEQRRAHDIIENHLLRTLAGQNPAQLLMIVRGEGGTGKTVLLNVITETFDHYLSQAWLAKTATTGVAASLIAGQTLHSWAGIPIHPSEGLDWVASAGKLTLEKRRKNIIPAKYLTVDEFSMLTKNALAILSTIIGSTKSASGEPDVGLATKPFGGMNIILFGDPHQFPPIGSPALYSSKDPSFREQLGRHLYGQFSTVVTLTEQKRVQDVRWLELLKRLRTGDCNEDDIAELRKLLVQNPACDIPEWGTGGWSMPTLITPRHSARMAWNVEMLAKHCAASGHRLYICQAEDTKGEQEVALTLDERIRVAGMKTRQTDKLAERTEVAVGMRGMIMLNLATESDLANGTRGTVVDIELDPREPEEVTIDDSTGGRLLQYPPALIKFKPDHCTAPAFEGLPQGILPVTPSRGRFSIWDRFGRRQTIFRYQQAITGAYAFTDYKSQGQTLGHVIIDLQSPPTGALTPFSAYVALSRSRGRETIRLLRGFDAKLFTTHPSEDLAEEDRRLARCTDDTERKFH